MIGGSIDLNPNSTKSTHRAAEIFMQSGPEGGCYQGRALFRRIHDVVEEIGIRHVGISAACYAGSDSFCVITPGSLRSPGTNILSACYRRLVTHSSSTSLRHQRSVAGSKLKFVS